MEISSERVDDIPLIVEMLKQMEIAKWIDKQLKQPHGNHQGLSYGQLSVILLIYIISLFIIYISSPVRLNSFLSLKMSERTEHFNTKPTS